MSLKPTASIVGVDWGTTHRRAYAISPSGECLSDKVIQQQKLLAEFDAETA
mgnify:CR=1 FL=1